MTTNMRIDKLTVEDDCKVAVDMLNGRKLCAHEFQGVVAAIHTLLVPG